MKNKASYIEPSDYFPKELRKKFGLGEYHTDTDEKKTAPRTGFIDDGAEWDYIARVIRGEENPDDDT